MHKSLTAPPSGALNLAGNYALNPIQEQVFHQTQKWQQKLAQGERGALKSRIICPPGSGKTLSAYLVAHSMGAQRIVYFINNRITGQQTMQEFKSYQSHLETHKQKSIGQCFNRKKEIAADFLVSTFESALNIWELISWNKTSVIFIDEADLIGLSFFRRQKLEALIDRFNVPVVALSATELQYSGKNLETYYPHEIFRLPIPESIPLCMQYGTMPKLKFYDLIVHHELQASLSTLKGMPSLEMNLESTFINILNRSILEFHTEKFKTAQKTEPALVVFFNNLPIDNFLAQAHKAGFKAAKITERTPRAERLKLIGCFLRGELDFLCGSDMLQRGINLRTLNVIYNCTMTYSPQVFWQTNGRVFRTDPNNPQKVGHVINVIPNRIVSQGAPLGLEDFPLFLSLFVDKNYWELMENYRNPDSLADSKSPYRRELGRSVLEMDLTGVHAFHSVREVLEFTQKMKKQRAETVFITKIKSEYRYDTWLESFRDSASIQKKWGAGILSKLGFPARKQLLSSDHKLIFERIFEIKLKLARALILLKQLKTEGIYTIADFLERYPSAYTFLKNYPTPVLKKLLDSKKDDFNNQDYRKLVRKLFGLTIEAGFALLWVRKLKSRGILSEFDFLERYDTGGKFQKEWGREIFTQLGLGKKMSFNLGDVQLIFERLYHHKYHEIQRLRWLRRFRTFGIVSPGEFLYHYPNPKSFRAVFGIQIGYDLNLTFHQHNITPNDYRQLVETLYQTPWEEMVRQKWLCFLRREKNIHSAEDFIIRTPHTNALSKAQIPFIGMARELGVETQKKEIYERIYFRLFGKTAPVLAQRVAQSHRHQLLNGLFEQGQEILNLLHDHLAPSREIVHPAAPSSFFKAREIAVFEHYQKSRLEQFKVLNRIFNLDPGALPLLRRLRYHARKPEFISKYLRPYLGEKFTVSEIKNILREFSELNSFKNRTLEELLQLTARVIRNRAQWFSRKYPGILTDEFIQAGNLGAKRCFEKSNGFSSTYFYKSIFWAMRIYARKTQAPRQNISLFQSMGNSDLTLIDTLPAQMPAEDPTERVPDKKTMALEVAIGNLNPLESQILIKKWGLFNHPCIREEEIASEMQLSLVSLRRIMTLATLKLRDMLSDSMEDAI